MTSLLTTEAATPHRANERPSPEANRRVGRGPTPGWRGHMVGGGRAELADEGEKEEPVDR